MKHHFPLVATASFVATAAFSQDVYLADNQMNAELISAITGADVATIIDQSDNAHHFSLSPSDAKKITAADRVIVLDNGYNTALADSVRDLRDGNGDDIFISCADYFNDCDSELGEDPHYWFNPENLTRLATSLAAQLDKEVPEALTQQLDDAAANFEVSGDFVYVADHAAFDHLINRFGVEIIGTVHDHNNQPKSAKERVELEESIDAHNHSDDEHSEDEHDEDSHNDHDGDDHSDEGHDEHEHMNDEASHDDDHDDHGHDDDHENESKLDAAIAGDKPLCLIFDTAEATTPEALGLPADIASVGISFQGWDIEDDAFFTAYFARLNDALNNCSVDG